MINQDLLKKLYISSLIFTVIIVAGAIFVTHSYKIYGGIAFGYVIGLIPFATWHWILHKTQGLTLPANRFLVFGVSLGKYAIILGALYIIISNKLLNALAIFGGMFIVFVILLTLSGYKALFKNDLGKTK